MLPLHPASNDLPAGSVSRKISSALGQGTPQESFAGAHRSTLTGWSPPLRAGLTQQIERLASKPPAALTDDHAGHAGHRPNSALHPLPADGPSAGAWSLDRFLSSRIPFPDTSPA